MPDHFPIKVSRIKYGVPGIGLARMAGMTDKPNVTEPAKPQRRWFQFRMRTLLVGMAVAGCGLGWLGVKVRDARRQQADVAAILKLGGSAEYDYDNDAEGNRVPNAMPPGPAWLRAVLGDDFFRDVTGVELADTPATDADLEHVRKLAKLKWLSLDGTQMTDAGLECLAGLTRLEQLSLVRTRITDAGLEHLQRLTQLQELHLYGTHISSGSAGLKALKQALPDCQILCDRNP